MPSKNPAILFGMAVIDIEKECPRGYNASAHLTEYVHMKSFSDSQGFCCIKVMATPLETREFFQFPTEAQSRFWVAREEWFNIGAPKK